MSAPEHVTAQLETIEKAKLAKLLDLIRRAAANGTSVEVAEAILQDWYPKCRVDPHGRVEILLGEEPK